MTDSAPFSGFFATYYTDKLPHKELLIREGYDFGRWLLDMKVLWLYYDRFEGLADRYVPRGQRRPPAGQPPGTLATRLAATSPVPASDMHACIYLMQLSAAAETNGLVSDWWQHQMVEPSRFFRAFAHVLALMLQRSGFNVLHESIVNAVLSRLDLSGFMTAQRFHHPTLNSSFDPRLIHKTCQTLFEVSPQFGNAVPLQGPQRRDAFAADMDYTGAVVDSFGKRAALAIEAAQITYPQWKGKLAPGTTTRRCFEAVLYQLSRRFER